MLEAHFRAVSQTDRRGCAFCGCDCLGVIAMAVAQFPAIRDNTVLSILYYVIAGCGASAATISSPGMRFR
jgi:hypothetical protein